MLIPLLLALAGIPSIQEPVLVSATVETEAFAVGSSYEILFNVQFPDAVVASKSGVPAPFLQIDVPPSVKLLGKSLVTFKELSQNEFVQLPYERLLTDPKSVIPFELIGTPAKGETIGLNLVAYVSLDDGSKPYFMRRRFELPLVAGSPAVEVKPTKSTWGIDVDLLQIGDELEPFALPLADGTEFDVSQWIGKKNIIITTYRAHW
ncbi:MAG: hypothetical protein ACI8QC_001228 [Planctomycetota bacterium]|jgi:hypothetical protein